MFEDKKITLQKIKDLLYATRNEVYNELDYNYESEFNFEYNNNMFNIMLEFLDKFLDKVELVIDDELED